MLRGNCLLCWNKKDWVEERGTLREKIREKCFQKNRFFIFKKLFFKTVFKNSFYYLFLIIFIIFFNIFHIIIETPKSYFLFFESYFLKIIF